MDAVTTQKQRFLPALAEVVGQWFPEVNGRSLAVSEVSITKENVPTLPLVMVAFTGALADPPRTSRVDMFDIVDTFVIDFWLEPARYKKANGTETPFWSYYDYEAIRDKLLTNLSRWDTPGGERIAFRRLAIQAEPLAVSLTFTFMATFRWCPSIPMALQDHGDPFTIGFNLCTPKSECCPEDCYPEPLVADPCAPESRGVSVMMPPRSAPPKGRDVAGPAGEPGPEGPQGPAGPAGPPGPANTSVAAFNYRADAKVTSPNDPGAGRIRWNNTDQQRATALYIDRLTFDDFDAMLVLLLSDLGDKIAIQDTELAVHYQIFRQTGPAFDRMDWFEVPVEFVSAGGSGVFDDKQMVSILVK